MAIKKKRYASVMKRECVACGSCSLVCPKGAITVPKGIVAEVDEALCVGCGICKKVCPASVIEILVREEGGISRNEEK